MNKKLFNNNFCRTLHRCIVPERFLASNLSKTEAVTSQDNEYNEISEALNNNNTLEAT